MTLSQSTKTMLSEINSAARGSLQRSMDLGFFIETASKYNMNAQLEDLAFSAKFLTKSFDLMKRIGKGGEGYDTIESEFTSQTEKSRNLIAQFLEKAEPMTRSHFSGTYLSLDTIALQNLMQLFHDLSWYKNYLIDRK